MLVVLSAPSTLGASLTEGVHTLGGRQFRVVLPATTPAPVMIVLHGNGGTGQEAQSTKSRNPDLAAAYILVGPDGPSKSWNIAGEKSKEDDQLYIGTTLVDHLATFDNVTPEFTLYGNSNGAALTNRIAIENDDARITTLITCVSQLNTLQYRSGSFYVGGAGNAYTTAKASLTSRALLQVTGGADALIPAAGGAGGISDGTAGGKLSFVEWQQSLLAYATAFGYSGGLAALSVDDAAQAKASYQIGEPASGAASAAGSGHVVGVNLKGEGHGAGATVLGQTAVNEFLGLSTANIAVGGGGGGGGGGGTGGTSCADASGTSCSRACSDEFDICVRHGTNDYSDCRGQIDDCAGPLARAGCRPSCVDTASMAAHDDSGGGGATVGIAIGGGVAAVALLAVAALVLRRRMAKSRVPKAHA